MLDNLLFNSVNGEAVTTGSFLLCVAASLVLGTVIALVYMFRERYTKSYVLALAILPVVVQIVIFLVNDSIGTGIAVAGAFSLVRFRSAPGTAKEIASIFLAMAVGLATGKGYIGIAVLLTVAVLAVEALYSVLKFGEPRHAVKELKITIPEGLNYQGVFDDIFSEYTVSTELIRVKTTNMGSLFQLFYQIELKPSADEKKMIDDIRCRNGNLEISCGMLPTGNEL